VGGGGQGRRYEFEGGGSMHLKVGYSKGGVQYSKNTKIWKRKGVHDTPNPGAATVGGQHGHDTLGIRSYPRPPIRQAGAEFTTARYTAKSDILTQTPLPDLILHCIMQWIGLRTDKWRRPIAMHSIIFPSFSSF